MLQMNCSNCDGLIKSALLAEVQVIECPQCVEIVAVKNVVVLPPPISISSYLKNFLRSVKVIFQLNKYNNFDLKTKYVISERLPKLLLRDDFRLKISHDLYGQINFDENKRLARLLNISNGDVPTRHRPPIRIS